MRFVPAALLMLYTTSSVGAAEAIIGRPSVTDGDTLVIQGTRIRLHGIDAPESAQLCKDAAGVDYRCGQRSALALADKIGQGIISCFPKDLDRYGRTVAVCKIGELDLNAWLVQQGFAIAYRRFSNDYVAAELEARSSERGLWAGAFQDPQDWRQAQRSDQSASKGPPLVSDTAAHSHSDNCVIKGNISSKGEKIYHVPGSVSYAKTRINTYSGERMFCTEEEAKAAGWRAPRG